MFLRKAYNKKTGRTYLSIIHGYWDPVSKQSRTSTVMKAGYLDELEKQYDDPIAHFESVAAQMDRERKDKKDVTVSIDMDEQVERGGANRKNFGHVVFSKVYHELEVDRFLKNARRHENFRFNTDAIMRLLVFSRLLFPGSKRAAVLNRDAFFDSFRFTLDDVYDALSHFHLIADALQRHLHEQVARQHGRETDLVYYDVTNYYFQADRQDDLRRKGPSKENKKSPIVQMGLMLDKNSLPISYRMFPGNKHDSQTLMPMLTEIKKTYGVNRVIVVADKALNSGDNIAYSTVLGDGYIYSKSVRGASADFKAWVLDGAGYRHLSDDYMLKSKLVPDVQINVTVGQGGGRKKKKAVKVEQKWVACYSRKYAERSKHKREEAVAKALTMIKNPAKYQRTFDYGAAGYIANLKVDKETGEILNVKDTLLLDTGKIEDEQQYDGYYAIVTSELDDTDEHILSMYQGLWHIEESFKITKSVLGARPIYLRTLEHINAHFLICFISLLIARLVERRLGGKYTIDRIAKTLRKVACSHLSQNLWLFDYADEVTDDMNAAFGTNFGRKNMTLQEIKNILGRAKRS
jgi:transposase